MTADMQEKYAKKIGLLLAKAESTNSEAERDSLISKAQELMVKYAIEQAMIDQGRTVSKDEIGQVSILFTGNYRYELMVLASYIASVNGCRCVQYQTTHDDGGRKAVRVTPDGYGGYQSEVTSQKKAYRLEVTGFKTDLDLVQIVEASLRLQAVSAMTNWWRIERPNHPRASYAHTVKMRREFVDGFARAVHIRLVNAKSKVEKEAEAATTGVEIALRDRRDVVDAWYDDYYGNSLRKTSRRHRTTLSAAAKAAGRQAGERADVGQPRFGSRKEIRS